MSVYTHSGDCSTSEPCPRCYEFGQTAEQARIIKLLWANVHTMTHPYDNEVIQSLRISPKALEALIKGENK